MGCKCKEKFNQLEKFSDDPIEEPKGVNFFTSFLNVLTRTFIGILSIVLIIIVAVPFFIYFLYTVIVGKEAHINMDKIIRLFKHDDE